VNEIFAATALPEIIIGDISPITSFNVVSINDFSVISDFIFYRI